MRGIVIGLILACSSCVALAAAPPALYRYGLGGELDSLPTRTLRAFDSRPVRDLAMGFGGDLLVLGQDGDLRRIAERDSLERSFLSADISASDWPEALSADGPDWLLLIRGGGAVLRLGRRGEAKEIVELDDRAIWRALRADRAGRLWVADEYGGQFEVLSRSGQRLQSWRLPMILPGYRGPIRDWCPDEQGGIYVAEGDPLRIHHLNAAGNPLGGWDVDFADEDIALAVGGSGELLLATAEGEGDLRLALRALPEEYALAHAGRIWVLAVEGRPAEEP